MNEFSDKVHKLQHDFKHSPWSEWANRKKAEKDAFFLIRFCPHCGHVTAQTRRAPFVWWCTLCKGIVK